MGMGSQGSVLWRIRIAATMAVTLRDSPATTVKVTQVSVIFRKVFFEAIEFSGLSDIKIESNGYFCQRIFIVTVFWRGRNGDRDMGVVKIVGWVLLKLVLVYFLLDKTCQVYYQT
jgi:hypothetical protein